MVFWSSVRSFVYIVNNAANNLETWSEKWQSIAKQTIQNGVIEDHQRKEEFYKV